LSPGPEAACRADSTTRSSPADRARAWARSPPDRVRGPRGHDHALGVRPATPRAGEGRGDGSRVAGGPIQLQRDGDPATGGDDAMEGGAAGVPDAAFVLAAGAMTEVWPPPELAGSGGQGQGFMGRWPGDRVTIERGASACPGVMNSCPASWSDTTTDTFTEASAAPHPSADSRSWCEQRPCHLHLGARVSPDHSGFDPLPSTYDSSACEARRARTVASSGGWRDTSDGRKAATSASRAWATLTNTSTLNFLR